MIIREDLFVLFDFFFEFSTRKNRTLLLASAETG